MLDNVAVGTSAWTATARNPRISPPAGPIAVAPTRDAAVGVLDDLDQPRARGRADEAAGGLLQRVRPIRTRSPALAGLLSVSPTPPTSGSVKVTCGTAW